MRAGDNTAAEHRALWYPVYVGSTAPLYTATKTSRISFPAREYRGNAMPCTDTEWVAAVCLVAKTRKHTFFNHFGHFKSVSAF